MTPPDNIEPSNELLGASEQSRRLVQNMERMNRTAEEAEAAAKKDAQFRQRLNTELAKDVRTSRVQAQTLASEGTAPGPKQTQAARDLTSETRKARTEAEGLTRARQQASTQLERDLATMRRYGQYAGQRYLAGQGRTPAQLAQLERMAQAGIGGGGGFSSLTGAGAGGGRVPLQLTAPPGTVTGRAAVPIGSQEQAGPFVTGAGGVTQQRTAAIQKEFDALGKLSGRTAQLSLTQADQNRVFSQGVNALSAHSNELRRHGALTTEFIAAAGRGSVTIRELGYQVGSTIGKFGGWLLAGSAVFVALDAIRQLGAGAIASSSGVNQLNRVLGPARVNADDAQQSFRALSEEFNLPIEDVTGAAYGMAKVFRTQEGAMQGAKAALFAVKVGELDVATATRYLTAIVNGFGLSGDDMIGVMDQLNQAQNKFGVSIPDTAAGVAKAAGTFKAAGGDISSLIALITTAQKVTGQTGEVVGTALARSPNFLRKPTNQAILQGFGIDASADINRVYEQAFELTKKLGGEQRQVLASAILGPQYGARVGTPLFAAADKYQEALKKTSPEASHNSSQRELNRLLDSMQERLVAITNSLQRVGSNLAQAGALAPFSLGLTVLQAMLDTTNKLLELFNELPAPLRTAALVGLQLYGTLRLMRRLQFGSLFPEGSAANSFFTPRNQTARIYREGLFNQQQYVNSELEAASRTRATLGTQALLAQQRLPRAQAALSGLSSEASLQEAQRAKARVAGLQATITTLDEQIVQAELVEADLMAQRTRIKEQQLLSRRGFSPTFLAGAYGTEIPGGTPESAATRNAAAREAAIAARASFIGPLTAADAKAYDRVIRGQSAMTQRINTLSQRGGLIGRGAAGVARAAQRFPASQIGSGLTRAATGLRNFGRSLASMVGPLDLVILGAFLAYEGAKHIMDKTDEAAQGFEGLHAGGYDSRAKLQKAIDKLEKSKAPAESDDLLEKASGAFADVANTVSQAYGNTDIAADPQDVQQQFADAAQSEIDRMREGARKAAANLHRGRTVPLQYQEFVFPEDVEKGLDKIVGRFAGGVGSVEKFNERTNNLIESVREAQNLSRNKQRQLISQIRLAQIDVRGPGTNYDELAQLTIEDQQKLLDSYSGIVTSGDATRHEIDQFMRVAMNQIADTLNKPGVENRAAAFEAAQTATDTIKGAADTERDRALLFARGQDDIDAAYDDYIKSVSPKTATEATRRQARDAAERLGRNVQSQQQLQKRLDTIGGNFFSGDTLKGIGGALLEGRIDDAVGKLKQYGDERKRLNDQLQQREQDEKGIRRELDGLKSTERLMKRRLEALREQARQERFDQRTDFLESLSSYRQALAPEGTERLQVQLNFVNRLIGRAIERYGRHSKEVLDLLAQRQGIFDEQFQAQTDLIRARGEYATAGIDNENTVAVARSELETARAILSRVQSNPHAGEQELLEASTEVRNAEQALNDAIEERADAIRKAQFELLRARAEGNEVRQARIDMREARYDLRTADTREEKLTARASLVNAKRGLIEARAQAEIEDVEFSADIGRLSLDAQIREYRRILRTMTLTKDLRRDLKRRIYQLKQDLEGEAGGFDLAVGDIKLPTIYEIRRAVGAGINQPPQVNVNSPTEINVNGAGDPETVANKVAAKQANAARKNRNKLRSAGII